MTEPINNDHDAVLVSETGAGRFQVEVKAAGSVFLADEPEEIGALVAAKEALPWLAS